MTNPYEMFEQGMEIPHSALEADTLRNLIEEFVTRDGTDYGAIETGLDARVAQVMKLLNRGEVGLFFYEQSGNCEIKAKR